MALWLNDSRAIRTSRIALVIALYWLVSIPMVFLNKYIFSSDDMRLNAPLFITWFQCLVAMCLSWLCLNAMKIFKPHADIKWLGISPEVTPAIAIPLLMKIMPLSVCFVAMVAFNNLCIKYVAVSFYMVVRSLATFFNIIFMYFLLKKTTSFLAMTCCMFVIIGFLLGVDQEDRGGTLSWLGVFFGVASSMFAALNGVFTTRVLPNVNNSPMKLALCNNLNACLLFAPLILLLREDIELLQFPRLNDHKFWLCLTISGVLGWSVNLVTSLQILVTSPLTHNISGTSKACVQTLIAVMWYDEFKTLLWWFSNTLVLLGSAFYTFVRHREMETKHIKLVSPQKPPDND